MNVFVALSVFLFFLPDPGVGGGKNNPSCPQIRLRFGRVRYRQKGKIARFVCNNGYMLAGDRFSVCVQGQWDNGSPRCVRATCKPVKPPANGLIYPTHSGAVLNFFCKSDYELRGPNVTYCDGTKWDNALPTCLHRDSATPLACDFERDDLCGWNHDPNHDFDWTRRQFATPSGSIGTGPSYDHTKGEGEDGYYMYIESSAKNVNDTARLISPVYESSPTENVCFEFFYHMFGTTIGELRVYLKKVNESWSLNSNDTLFVRRGNQGNRWHRGVVELGPVDVDYQIIVEGVRGKSYVSDIAIDDVRLIPKCTPDDLLEPTTTEIPWSSSEQPISVESCENRCQTNDTQKSDTLLTCDCDDGCFERNRCCPDYFDFCAFATSSDDFVDESTATTEQSIITQKLITTTIPTTPKTTKKPTTKQPTTQTTQTTRKVEKLTTTTRKPPTTKPPTTKKSKIIYVTPDDIATLPTLMTTEEQVTPELPPKEHEDTDHRDSDKQKIIIPYKEGENNTKTVIFGVGVVFGLLFAVAGMAFVAKRYRLFRCTRLRRLNHHSGNGDSQSDVRFLTGDEILDLNLPSDYHTM